MTIRSSHFSKKTRMVICCKDKNWLYVVRCHRPPSFKPRKLPSLGLEVASVCKDLLPLNREDPPGVGRSFRRSKQISSLMDFLAPPVGLCRWNLAGPARLTAQLNAHSFELSGSKNSGASQQCLDYVMNERLAFEDVWQLLWKAVWITTRRERPHLAR